MKVLFQVSESEKIPLSYIAIKNMASQKGVESVIAIL